VVNMGKEALFISSILFACGLAVFWFYGRRRTKKDFALLHLIERIAAREFVDISLESELKEIILERDEIIKDRFDRMIEDSMVLDIDKSMTAVDFFKLIAEKMSSKIDADPSFIFRALLDREEQSSTVLDSGLAIPHNNRRRT